MMGLGFTEVKKRSRAEKRKHGITRQEYLASARLYVRRGVDHRSAKLTPEIVQNLRINRHGKSDATWARELGVARETIRDARTGATWANVEPA